MTRWPPSRALPYDRALLAHWLPPQAGVVPKLRFGRHCVNVLWALPVIFYAYQVPI